MSNANSSPENPMITPQPAEGIFSCDPSVCEYLGADTDFDELEIVIASGVEETMAAFYWDIRSATDRIQATEDDLAQIIDDMPLGRDLKRRLSPKGKAKSTFNNLKRESRSASEKGFAKQLGNKWDMLPVHLNDPADIAARIDGIDSDIRSIMRSEKSEEDDLNVVEKSNLYRAYTVAIGHELDARLRLALLSYADPDLASHLFQPETLDELSEPAQRMIAADIIRGEKGSVVLQHVKRISAGKDGHDQQMMDYLAETDQPKDVQNTLKGVGVCAMSLTGVRCPLNRFGICKDTLDRVPLPDDTTTEIDRDLEKRSAVEGRETISALQRFANKFGKDPLKVNVSGYTIDRDREAITAEADARTDEIMDSIEQLFAESGVELEIEIPFSEVRAVFGNGRELVITPDQGSDAAEEYIQAILNEPMFAKYIETHNSKNMTDSLRRALIAILFKPGNGAIDVVHGKGFKIIDGHRTRLHRLSGRYLNGGGGGHIVRDTRILFYPIGEGTKRTVIFQNVLQKAANEKRSSLPK